MAMKMNKAFNSRMQSKIIRYKELSGYYNEFNEWVRGFHVVSTSFGVILAGNKFSQFDEGISRKATEGGERFSDYRSLYIQDKFERLNLEDKVYFRDTYYNVLQESDEAVFGFHSYLLEKPKNFVPNILPENALFHLGVVVTHNGIPVTHTGVVV